MLRLTNMSVIVTGGASGIGLAAAKILTQHGARVFVADLKHEAVEHALSEINALECQRARGLACDVRSAADCARVVDATLEHFGSVDALVHCAGILRPSGSRPRPLHELEDEEYDAVVDTNLKGTFLMNRAALRPMIAQRGGQIVNISSTSGRKGRPLDSVYSASKAGMIALSESVAEEVRPFGVRVQVIMPDAVDTPLWKQNGTVQSAPPQSLPAERIAELIAFCLALPPDTICENLVIGPFRSRVGRRGAPPPGAILMRLKGFKMFISAGVVSALGMASLVAALLALSTRTAAGAETRDFSHRLRVGGRTRTYEVHVPTNYDGKTPLPVVLNLHGGGSNATVHRRQTQMDKTSDHFGFIVVYPEGTSGAGRFYTWNAGLCCSYAMKWKVDDVGFISRLLDELPKQYSVDVNRIYATGMSNGAMMCYRLACELSTRITAICGVSSTMGVEGPRPRRQAVPIMQIHGLKDPNAPFDGGVGENAISKVHHKGVRNVIRWWCEVNHCDFKPTEIIRSADNTMELYTPRPSEAGAPIVLYTLPEGGHTWPSGVDVTPRLGTGKLIATFDANTKMWEFFRQFTLATAAAPGKRNAQP